MDTQQAKPDTAQVLMEMCRAQFNDQFTYFIGIPDVFPEAALPALVVQKLKSNITAGPTGGDDVTEQIMISLITTVKNGVGSPDDDDTVMRQLQMLVEAIDPTTNTYFPTSLAGIVRRNITLRDNVLDNSLEINYDVSQRPGQPNIIEATIIMSTREIVYVVNRT